MVFDRLEHGGNFVGVPKHRSEKGVDMGKTWRGWARLVLLKKEVGGFW